MAFHVNNTLRNILRLFTMEYDYVHDTITGGAKAIFSTEHEVLGPWLEVEVGSNFAKLEQLLVAIDKVEQGVEQEVNIIGLEYSVVIDQQDICVQTNASLNGEEILPIELQEEAVNFDAVNISHCGLEDFRAVLLSWAKFTKMN